jgi:hypothetical protein
VLRLEEEEEREPVEDARSSSPELTSFSELAELGRPFDFRNFILSLPSHEPAVLSAKERANLILYWNDMYRSTARANFWRLLARLYGLGIRCADRSLVRQ